MSDPRYPERDPRYDDKPHTRFDRDSNSSYMGWIIGGAAVVVVLAILMFGLGDSARVAKDSAPETTTGQTTRPPTAPAPGANPAPQNPAPRPSPNP